MTWLKLEAAEVEGEKQKIREIHATVKFGIIGNYTYINYTCIICTICIIFSKDFMEKFTQWS